MSLRNTLINETTHQTRKSPPQNPASQPTIIPPTKLHEPPKRPALTTYQPPHPSPSPFSSPNPHKSTTAHGTELQKHPIHPTHALAEGVTEAGSKENKALQAQEVESTGIGT
jgi:hypothetical protein